MTDADMTHIIHSQYQPSHIWLTQTILLLIAAADNV
jgi:hypothetical protein